MEFIEGIPLYETEKLKKFNHLNVQHLSELIMDVFYTMTYKHGFIHAGKKEICFYFFRF